MRGNPQNWVVGERVVYCDRIVTIDRVTPSGMPVIGDKTFLRDGRERGGGYTIVRATPEIEAKLAEAHALQREIRRWQKAERAVYALLPGFRMKARISSDALRRICDAIEAEVAGQQP